MPKKDRLQKLGPLRRVLRVERRLVEVKKTYRLCLILECGHAEQRYPCRDAARGPQKRTRCSNCVVVKPATKSTTKAAVA